MKRFFWLLLLWVASTSAMAQIGVIEGYIKDDASNQPLPGATVHIQNSTVGTATDGEGRFILKKVVPGIHVLVVKHIGYQEKTVPGVRVEAHKTTMVSVSIKEERQTTGEVEVVSTRKLDTEISVLSDIRRADEVAVGVSQEQINRTQDLDAAHTMRRMSSMALADDRLILIRGLSERYSASMINDVLTPSMEADGKSFSYDIIPNPIIDRIMVYKSGGAELPAEFGGGVIKLTTKDVPDKNRQYFGLGISFRDGTSMSTFMKNKEKGNLDFLGFDDGSRELPASFPRFTELTKFRTVDQVNKVKFGSTWGVDRESFALPDLRLNYGFAHKFHIGKMIISNLTTINYSNNYINQHTKRYRYSGRQFSDKPDTVFKFTDFTSIRDIRSSVIHNWSVTFNHNHKIEFRNLFNMVGKNEAIMREGPTYRINYLNDNRTSTSRLKDERIFSSRYESRSIYSGQLNGTHHLSDHMTAEWIVGYGLTNRYEPDWKRSTLERDAGTSSAYGASFDTLPNIRRNSHFWSNMNEKVLTGSFQIEDVLNPNADEDNHAKVKLGVYYEKKNREFWSRWFSYRKSFIDYNRAYDNLPYDRAFQAQYVDDTTGFRLMEGTRASDQFTASNLLLAPYASLHLPIGDLGLIAGVRMEKNQMRVEGFQDTTSQFFERTTVAEINKTDFFPSANLYYNLDDEHTIRAAYARSVNRPSFRELSTYRYYDFHFNTNMKGNPNLINCYMDNVDLRWEFYPRRGDFISAGVFAKRFTNPIEQRLVYDTVSAQHSYDTLAFTFMNAASAMSYGLEIEVRKSLQGMHPSPILNRISLGLNLSLIRNRVDLGKNIDLAKDNRVRPMMGQSPYMINAGIYYDDDKEHNYISIMYNVFGPRVFAVGNAQYPTQYEMPRHVIDLNIAKRIQDRYEIRMSIQDLLNAPFYIKQDNNNNGKIEDSDSMVMTYRRGTWVTAALTYRLY